METISKLLVLLICFPLVSAQFPIECRSNSSDLHTQGSGICCPLFNNEVCGGSQRGQCMDINTTCRIPDLGNYDRWLGNFSKICVCQPNFTGAKCEQCWYGLTATADGKSCNGSSETRVRRDFLELSDDERENYTQVLQLMKNTPSSFYIAGSNPSSSLSIYDYLAALHFMSMMPETDPDLAHDGPGFPTWHRAFLLLFERLAQDVSGDSMFSLPYVNEYNATAVNQSIKLLGGDGMNMDGCYHESKNCSCYLATVGPGSYFSTWKNIGLYGTSMGKISRALGCEETGRSSPDPTALDYAIKNEKYSEPPWTKNSSQISFSNLLEGYANIPDEFRTKPYVSNKSRDNHNRLHVYMGGTMDNVKTAASDPFFWLHHGFIDLMLEKWMTRHPASKVPWTTTDAPPGHSYNDCQALFLPLRPQAMFFNNSVAYGYTYDQFVGPTSFAPVSTSSLVVTTLVIAALVIKASLFYY